MKILPSLLKKTFLKIYRNFVVSRIHGKIPEKHNGLIIIANHKAGADPVILESSLGIDIHFIVDARFFLNKVSDFFFSRFVDGMPGSSKLPFLSLRGLREGIRILRRGGVVGIYPEGVMVRNPRIPVGDFKYGAAYLSIKTTKPVVPVYIYNVVPGPLPQNPDGYELGLEGFCSVLLNIGNEVEILIGKPLLPLTHKVDRDSVRKFTEVLRNEMLLLYRKLVSIKKGRV